jgi:hypothetical protein
MPLSHTLGSHLHNQYPPGIYQKITKFKYVKIQLEKLSVTSFFSLYYHHHLYFHKSGTVQDVEKSIQIQNKQYRVQCQYSYRGK